jgi:hypothetical protein
MLDTLTHEMVTNEIYLKIITAKICEFNFRIIMLPSTYEGGHKLHK